MGAAVGRDMSGRVWREVALLGGPPRAHRASLLPPSLCARAALLSLEALFSAGGQRFCLTTSRPFFQCRETPVVSRLGRPKYAEGCFSLTYRCLPLRGCFPVRDSLLALGAMAPFGAKWPPSLVELTRLADGADPGALHDLARWFPNQKPPSPCLHVAGPG